MATSLGISQNKQTGRPRNRLTIAQRKWLLSAHLLFMAVWFGGSICSLAFNITALVASDPHQLNAVYVLGDILDRIILRGGVAGSAITGILLAVLTQWGLFRFYWLTAKEIISILCVAVDFIVITWNERLISLTTAQSLHVLSNPLYLSNRTLLFVGILFRLIALGTIIVISIFKPWGQRKRSSQRETPRPSHAR